MKLMDSDAAEAQDSKVLAGRLGVTVRIQLLDIGKIAYFKSRF